MNHYSLDVMQFCLRTDLHDREHIRGSRDLSSLREPQSRA